MSINSIKHYIQTTRRTPTPTLNSSSDSDKFYESDNYSCKSDSSSSSSGSDNSTIVNETNKILSYQTNNVIFKLPNNTNNTTNETYIFGDIEGNKKLFDSTIETIHKTKDNENVNYVFLGDLYDYNAPSETILTVEKIMNELNIPINPLFNENTKEIDVIRSFRKLWKNKQMKCYSKYNIQYVHSKLKPENIYNSKWLFILGNKEIIFVQEIITSEHITKTEEGLFNVPADYKMPDKQNKHTDYKFSYHELNVMYSFITICNNYAVIDKTLFIHCYLNYKSFNNEMKTNIKHIISGHSKGYGHFIDTEFKNIDIYIVDLTHYETTENESIVNYMYMTSSGINYHFNKITKPKLKKIEALND